MQEVELSDSEWRRLKRWLMSDGMNWPLRRYVPPIKLMHGSEYFEYEKSGCQQEVTIS